MDRVIEFLIFHYQTIGKDLPDCSGKPRPAVWRQIPGPKLKQITVGPKVNLLFLRIPDISSKAVFGMTEDGEVFKKRKGHVALSPGVDTAQYIKHFHVTYFHEE